MLALATGGFSYSRRRDSVQLGPLRASIQEKQRVAIPPLLSAAVILAGVGCVVIGFRRRK
jgi:hypothetical protein